MFWAWREGCGRKGARGLDTVVSGALTGQNWGGGRRRDERELWGGEYHQSLLYASIIVFKIKIHFKNPSAFLQPQKSLAHSSGCNWGLAPDSSSPPAHLDLGMQQHLEVPELTLFVPDREEYKNPASVLREEQGTLPRV